MGARTSRIEIGTGVIDMRYENPLYMVEDAGSADLIGGGRLQLGISRGSPEQVIDGWRHFGYGPAQGETDADMGRRHAEVFLHLLKGQGFCQAQSESDVPEPARPASARAAFGGLARSHLVGLCVERHRHLGGQAGHEPAKLDPEGR
ncbi:LLM class flavin-dependent oxidoreductase [Sphingomonas sp. I4]